MNRYIIHCDMDNYFASVEALDKPYLNDVPFVVSGDPAMRHGIVLSKNNLAKSFGIVTGESVYEAKRKCKGLGVIKPNYTVYLKYTKLSRAIYYSYTKKVYPYGMDEAWLDVTESCHNLDDAIKIAREIKSRIKKELNLSISIGLSFNYVFAKLGSDQKLKDDIYVIDDDFVNITENMPAFSLLFVGSKTRTKLFKDNILTIGDLRRTDINFLKQLLGKKGEVLKEFSTGDDSQFIPTIENDEEIKSIGNTITPPKAIVGLKDLEAFSYIICNIICERLKKHHLQTKTMQVKIKYDDFSVFSKQATSSIYIFNLDEIYKLVHFILIQSEYQQPIRSISIRACKLIISKGEQTTLFDSSFNQELDNTIKELTKKYGKIYLERSIKK